MPIWIAQAKAAPAEAWLVAGNYDEGLVGHALPSLPFAISRRLQVIGITSRSNLPTGVPWGQWITMML